MHTVQLWTFLEWIRCWDSALNLQLLGIFAPLFQLSAQFQLGVWLVAWVIQARGRDLLWRQHFLSYNAFFAPQAVQYVRRAALVHTRHCQVFYAFFYHSLPYPTWEINLAFFVTSAIKLAALACFVWNFQHIFVGLYLSLPCIDSQFRLL